MSERPERAERIRLGLTLTRANLDHLVEEGLYMERQEAIRAALRLLFRFHGPEPFRGPEGPPEEDGEEAD